MDTYNGIGIKGYFTYNERKKKQRKIMKLKGKTTQVLFVVFVVAQKLSDDQEAPHCGLGDQINDTGNENEADENKELHETQ